MIKVKTFAIPLAIFQVRNKLKELDEQVNQFLEQVQAKRVVAVSDTHTTDDSGATMGLIRVVTYEV
jgi:hypothetical protein